VLPARTYVQCKLDMSGNADGMRVNKYTIAMDLKVKSFYYTWRKNPPYTPSSFFHCFC
jgi:hypothetical protein